MDQPSPDAIDDALRGLAPMTPAIEDAIINLDSALQIQPTPEKLQMYLSNYPVSPQDLTTIVGRTFTEPSYMKVKFLTDESKFDAGVTLGLIVPAGIPAMYFKNGAGLPSLVLARGLTWRVDFVDDLGNGKTFITAVVLPLAAAA